jgi:hypothetical protein
MLKLIVSQTNKPTDLKTFCRDSKKTLSTEQFSANIHPNGPFLYTMTVQDPSHFLACELVLEVEAKQKYTELNTVICHLPSIQEDDLSNLVEDDETLFCVIMIQFQMKILGQLLLFCINQKAAELKIYADDTYAGNLGIYHEFLSYGDPKDADSTDYLEIVVPINQQTYTEWIDFMNQICLKLRQSLWQNQKKNFAIKKYLKSHPFDQSCY